MAALSTMFLLASNAVPSTRFVSTRF